MKYKIAGIIFFLLGCATFGYAQESMRVNSQQLIDQAVKIDGKTVIFKGEVIGDIMRRRGYAWFNVEDENNAIGIWAPLELIKTIGQAGDYQHKGGIVEVEGKFVRADKQLGGELCIRAQKIKVLKEGYRIFHVVKPAKVETTLALAVMALCLFLLSVVFKKHIKLGLGR